MAVVGTSRQEQKVQEMGEICHEIEPRVGLMDYKGVLRMGIKIALEKGGYGDWKDLYDKSPSEKAAFFDGILEGAKPRLSLLGIPGEQMNQMFNALRARNREYIHGA